MPRIIMLRDWEYKFNNNYLAVYKKGQEYLVVTRCADAAVRDDAAIRKEDYLKCQPQQDS
jgi:hypothetical protein